MPKPNARADNESVNQASGVKRWKRSGEQAVGTYETRPLFTLPTQVSELVDLYFSHTQNWFPIIERHEILRLSYQYDDNPVTIGHDDTKKGSHAALWALLAYAQVQESAPLSTEHSGPSQDYYKIVMSLIPENDFEVGHVQALLLLVMINIGYGKWSEAWLLCGRVVRSAIDLNLGSLDHSIPKSQSINQDQNAFFWLLHLGYSCVCPPPEMSSSANQRCRSGWLPDRGRARRMGSVDQLS